MSTEKGDKSSEPRSRLRARSPPGQANARKGSGVDAALGAGNGTVANDEDAEDIEAPAHFADSDAAATHLGAVAGRHFHSLPAPKEGEVVVNFLYRCRVGDKTLRVAAT
ncbi:hypothetical protein CBOM_06489 [Ceraceosorus bombacis]|uniref:Uncharacterized protein n=1 Tax=Ceraceosorus bombacis TaxID=401625 RepID=A0A0P1BLH4_9BASI|nr:hypothetical protein CBOM_06489 [Ceraceosorus bombacis]